MKNWIWKNLANIVTGFGFFLVLWLIIVLVCAPERLFLAFLLFLIAGATDYLDGKIARRFNIISDVGKLLDRIRDKMLVCSIFPLLLWYHWPKENFFFATTITLALIIGIMMIELFLFIAGFVGTIKGWDVGASRSGKVKMFAEFIVITFWFSFLAVDKYLQLDLFQYLVYVLDAMLAVVLYLSIKSLGGYCQRYNIPSSE